MTKHYRIRQARTGQASWFPEVSGALACPIWTRALDLLTYPSHFHPDILSLKERKRYMIMCVRNECQQPVGIRPPQYTDSLTQRSGKICLNSSKLQLIFPPRAFY